MVRNRFLLVFGLLGVFFSSLVSVPTFAQEAKSVGDTGTLCPSPPRDGGSLVREFLGVVGVPDAEAEGPGAPDLQTMAAARGFQIEYLAATVPEPGLGFDGMVSAIIRGIQAADFTLDRFWLPWQGLEGGEERALGGCSKHYPGSLLFVRSTHGPSKTAQTDRHLLVLSLIGELQASGIQRVAFLRAMQDGKRYLKEGDELRLLSPSFPGSAESLRLLLSEGGQRTTPFRVLSGRTADSKVLKAVATDGGVAAKRSFQATVLPDEVLADAFYAYLVNNLGAKESDIAIIAESSTVAGQSAMDPLLSKKPAYDTSKHRPRLILPMPMHLSRLQRAWAQDRGRGGPSRTGEAQDKDGPQSPAQSGPQLSLPYIAERGRERSDSLPQLSRDTTLSEDRALATILTTIFDENIRFVGLYVSDVRDKVFLAQQIRKFSPDVELFTFESDLLYTHPDLRTALKGMLVVSSYPLFSRNQQWSAPFDGWNKRLQFSRGADQGVYNATVALLGRADQLLEYSAPVFSREGRMPLLRPVPWLSAVGNDTLFPLAVLSFGCGERCDNHTGQDRPLLYAPPLAESIKEGVRSYPYHQGALTLGLLLCTLFGFGHALLYYFHFHHVRHLDAARGRRRLDEKDKADKDDNTDAAPGVEDKKDHAHSKNGFATLLDAVDIFRRLHLPKSHNRRFHRERRLLPRYIIACLMPQLLALFVLRALHGLQLHDVQLGSLAVLSWPFVLSLFADATFFLLLIAACDALIHLFFWDVRERFAEKLHERSPLAPLFAMMGITLVGMLLVSRGLGVLSQVLRHNENLVITLRRAALPAYGLSPAVPLLLLLLGVYLWGFYQLRRVRLLEKMAAIQDELLDELCDDIRLHGEIAAAARSLESPPPIVLPIGLGLALVLAATLFSRLVTLEAWQLTWIFRFLFALVATFVWFCFLRFLRLWRHFRRFLHLLGHQRMTYAFDRMPTKFARTLSVLLLEELPELTKREALALHFDLLRNHMRQIDFAKFIENVSKEDAPGLADNLQKLKALCESGAPQADLPPQNPVPVSLLILRMLKAFWAAQPMKTTDKPLPSGNLVSTNTADLYIREMPDHLHLWLRLCEDFIALQVVAYIDRLFPHLRNALFFSTAGMLVLLSAVATYPFQPANFLSMLVWFMIIAIAGMTLYVLVQMNRDEVLSRVAKSEPGKLSWDRHFLSQVVLYVALPLLSLFATQVPSVGQGVFFWLEPVLRILK